MKMCWMPVCVLYFFPNFILVRVFFSVRSFLFVSAVHSRFIYYIRLGFHLYWWGLWCSFTRSHSHSISFTWHIHSQCNTMSREIDLIVVLFGVNFLLFYSIFVRWSCARECAAYLNVFFTYITLLYSSFPRLSRSLFNIWAVFFPHFSSHFGCFSLFGSLLVQHFMYTYIMLMMSFHGFDGMNIYSIWKRKEEKISKQTECFMRYIYVNFNDVYLCVQALLTKTWRKRCVRPCVSSIYVYIYWWREAKKKNGKPEILYTDNRIHTPLDCGVAEQRI